MRALPVQPRWRTFPTPFLLWAKGGMSSFMLLKMTPLLSTRQTSQILLIHRPWSLGAATMLGHDPMSMLPLSMHTKTGLKCTSTQLSKSQQVTRSPSSTDPDDPKAQGTACDCLDLSRSSTHQCHRWPTSEPRMLQALPSSPHCSCTSEGPTFPA